MNDVSKCRIKMMNIIINQEIQLSTFKIRCSKSHNLGKKCTESYLKKSEGIASTNNEPNIKYSCRQQYRGRTPQRQNEELNCKNE